MTRNELAAMIDHTLLKADAAPADIATLCAEAIEHGFATVCVNGCHVPFAARLLAECPARVCCVVGFPLGAMATAAKALEAANAVSDGATEIDMVMAVGQLKAGDAAYVEQDIRAVVQAVRGKAQVKVILETCLLDDTEIQLACALAEKAGAAFVKTSTGFSGGGATENVVRLMREAVGMRLGVKASGGIRTRDDALGMIAAGASRLGTSASIHILASFAQD